MLPLVLGGQTDLPHGHITALRQRRQRRDGTALQRRLGLLKDPWVAEAAPADHGGVSAGKVEDGHGILRREHVAVGDNGDGHRLLHLTDGDPVRLSGVHLGAGAAVNGHRRHPCLLQHPGQLHGIDAALVPAPTHFHRHRHRAGLHHRLGDAGGPLRVLHQGGAVTVGDHLAHGTAHVDVDEVGAGQLGGHAGGFRHAGGVAAEDLHPGRMLPRPQTQQTAGLAVLIAQGLGADHLGDGKPCPQLPADLAEGQIGDPGHRGQDQPGIHMDAADVHGVSSLSGDIAPQYSTWREKRKAGEKETGGEHRSSPAGVIFFPEEPDRRCGPIPPRPPR